MNMWGNIGGAIAATVNGYLPRWFHGNWNITFYVSAATYLVAVVLWKFLDPVTPPLQPDQPRREIAAHAHPLNRRDPRENDVTMRSPQDQWLRKSPLIPPAGT